MEATASEQVQFYSRLIDHSSPTSTIELPIVREPEFRQTKFSLLHVQVNEHSRIDLRIYDPRAFLKTYVLVEVYGEDTESMLTSFQVELWAWEGDVETLFPPVPSYFYLGDMATKYPAVREERSVRITITPLTTGMDCWAMASVTDNDTNRISLFTPQ